MFIYIIHNANMLGSKLRPAVAGSSGDTCGM